MISIGALEVGNRQISLNLSVKVGFDGTVALPFAPNFGFFCGVEFWCSDLGLKDW